MSDPESANVTDFMETIFEVDETSLSGTRQEAYTKRDRDLLLALLSEFDTPKILFSVKRDAETSARKKE